MTRTLPWLREEAKASLGVTEASLFPAKQSNTQTSPDSRAISGKIAADGSTRTVLKTLESSTKVRSSSNSPPPPPPVMELMRTGLDADDIYIMVEDEFHSVAQSYTQHLHHAEYKRLRNLAKQRHADDIRQISRPTVGSSISKERQINRIQANKARKQSDALQNIGANGKRVMQQPTGNETSDSEIDFDIAKEDNSLAGTALGSLMSGQRELNTSLVGLQGISSSTKAAKGFGRPKDTLDRSSMYDIGDGLNKHDLGNENSDTSMESLSDEESDSEDLDRQSCRTTANSKKRSSKSIARKLKQQKVTILEPGLLKEHRLERIKNDRIHSRHFSGKGILKKRHDDIHYDSAEDSLRPSVLLAGGRASSHKRTTKIDTEGAVDEIPIFLV